MIKYIIKIEDSGIKTTYSMEVLEENEPTEAEEALAKYLHWLLREGMTELGDEIMRSKLNLQEEYLQ